MYYLLPYFRSPIHRMVSKCNQTARMLIFGIENDRWTSIAQRDTSPAMSSPSRIGTLRIRGPRLKKKAGSLLFARSTLRCWANKNNKSQSTHLLACLAHLPTRPRLSPSYSTFVGLIRSSRRWVLHIVRCPPVGLCFL